VSRLPGVKPRELVAALKRAGFVEDHRKGSHLYLWHPGKRRMTSVPTHPRDVHRGLVRAIIKQADLTEAEFLALL
jgi:predicted RNA binding protein YcfA (HicA-like mRNA interferase family)